MGGSNVNLSIERIESLSANTGFKSDMIEKASHLISLLDMISNDDYLKDRVVLKGGTALNLFYFELPRLSIDIDLNYIGSRDAEVMKAERDQIERVLTAIFKHLQLNLAKLPDEYACRKYTGSYHSFFSGRGNLQLDINYLHRVTYWNPTKKDSCAFGELQAKNVPVISLYELAGGKLGALLARTASRDLFDVAQLASLLSPTDENLRLAYVLYGAKQPKDWRKVTMADITVSVDELADRLIPVLNTSIVQSISSPKAYAEELLATCRTFLEPFFPLRQNETEFIEHLRMDGRIIPTLLTADPTMCETIRHDPPLLWRASRAGS
jgi:predicted nucleotidyltransferase component of viral defense system